MNNQQYTSEYCCLGRYQRRRKETLQRYFEASQVSKKVNLGPLEPLAAFAYLERTITYNNRYWVVLYQNLVKVRRWWVVVYRVMHKTVTTVRLGQHCKMRWCRWF